MWDDKPFREELEKLGESEVRAILARGDQWANLNNRRRVAQDWLLSLEVARESEDSLRKKAREEEANQIARSASFAATAAAAAASEANALNRPISRRAWRSEIIAAIAAIAAIIAAIAAVKGLK